MRRRCSGLGGSLWAGLLVLLVALAGGSPARAVVISIGGTEYDVVLTTAGSSYLAERDLITPAPWFGSSALATEAAINFHAATGGSYGITPGTTGDMVIFVHDETGPLAGDTYSTISIQEPAGTPTMTSGSVNGSGVISSAAFAYVAPVAVPEIDGGALAKALFLLFTLHVWLQVRRNRRARG